MKITVEEKIMYKVMKAIYDSGIPISFKGSMVLKACLLELGYDEDTRHTVDIDANKLSDLMRKGAKVSTSTPTIADIENYFDNLFEKTKADYIIHFTI